MRGTVFPAILAPIIVSSCGGQTSDTSDAGGAPPDVFAQVTIGPSAANPTACLVKAQLLAGTAAPGTPVPVTMSPAHGVVGACSVAPAAQGFDVAVNVIVQQWTAYERDVYFATPAGKGAVTAGGATGVTAIMQISGYSFGYQQDDCTISFTYEGKPVSVDSPVATGRIWGHLSCPNALYVENAGNINYPGPLEPNTECDIEADFLFDNCNGSPSPWRPEGFPP